MALQLFVTQQPYKINFSGNPLIYSFAFSPYGQIERNQDIRIQVTIQAETVFQSGVFDDVYSKTFFPSINGSAQLDIRSFADAYLKFYKPRPLLNQAVLANGQFGRFRILVNAMKDLISIQDTFVSDIINVIKGGLSYEQFDYSQFFEQAIIGQKKPLHFFTDKEIFHKDDIRFLYWLYTSEDAEHQKVYLDVTDSTGTVHSDVYELTLDAYQWAIYVFPLGYDQLRYIFTAIPWDDFTPVLYSVRVADVSVFVAPTRFYIEQRQYYDRKQLIYTNSLGGKDTCPILGDVDYSADYTSTQAQRITPPSGIEGALLAAQNITAFNEETEKFSGNTNFISKDKINRYRDLLLSTDVIEVRNDTPDRLRFYPVIVNKKTVKFYMNKDRLVGMLIEWQNAWANSYYSPAGIIPFDMMCPALQSFKVIQLTKNTLQIIWAMPMPYDLIQVSVFNPDPAFDETITLEGNAGSTIISFNNPLDYPDTETVTVKGRVVCNRETNPWDMGPYSQVDLEIFADSVPVVNDDLYAIAAGYTDPVDMTGSVLDNDYDPDGDDIQVVAATGATAAGGTYNINADGTFTYLPPSALYNGTDSFTYTVEQVSNTAITASATVRINVGNIGLGDAVYVKIEKRNHQETDNSNGAPIITIDDVWFTFWADPLATIPKNVPFGTMWLNYNFKHTRNNPPYTTSVPIILDQYDALVPVSGTEFRAATHLVTLMLHLNLGAYWLEKRTYTVTPGAGYVPI